VTEDRDPRLVRAARIDDDRRRLLAGLDRI
jgi:hypothetical protein